MAATKTNGKTNGKARTNGANGEAKAVRPRRDFWEQTWQAPRVRMALEKMGVDPEKFRKAYDELPSSGQHTPTRVQIEAVHAFYKHNDFTRLQRELGRKTPAGVASTLKRVQEHETARAS